MPLYMANFKIDEIMIEILELFREEGNLTTGALVNQTGRARNTVTKRLDRLRAGGYIEYVDEPTGLHRLIEDPREGHKLPVSDNQQSLDDATTGDSDSDDSSAGGGAA